MASSTSTYDDARAPVSHAMKILHYDWMDVIPSHYPPNLYPRVLTWKGRVGEKDHLPMKGITRTEYQKYKAVDAKYLEIIWEFTPNGIRAEKPLLLETKRVASSTYWSFGSCNGCWKLSRRNFTDTSRTPHPLDTSVDNPNLPRMGRCGCICCNLCILELELHPANKKECYVHCPYCGSQACFSKNLRIWVVSKEVKELNELNEVKSVMREVKGAKVSNYEDGVMVDLGYL
jgi:hypothetical protein